MASGTATCAVMEDGTLQCWGCCAAGVLGTGNSQFTSRPTPIPGLSDVTAAVIGGGGTTLGAGEFICALHSDGFVDCLGNNAHGELGDGTTDADASSRRVQGVVGAKALAAGESHVCALLDTTEVLCWGSNISGAIGNPAAFLWPIAPVAVVDLMGVSAIAAGGNHTCAVLATGAVECWGHWGTLGNAIVRGTMSSTPVTISGLADVDRLAAGFGHDCVVSSGSLVCFGDNEEGQLGQGDTAVHVGAVSPSGIAAVMDVAAGGLSSCAVLADGTARCWGSDTYGQLGDPTINILNDPFTPVGVAGVEAITEVAVGISHACALLANGTAVCWGNNDVGQLGSAAPTSSLTPVPVVK